MKRREFLTVLLGSAAVLTAGQAVAGGHKEKENKGNKGGKSADHRMDGEKKGHGKNKEKKEKKNKKDK